MQRVSGCDCSGDATDFSTDQFRNVVHGVAGDAIDVAHAKAVELSRLNMLVERVGEQLEAAKEVPPARVLAGFEREELRGERDTPMSRDIAEPPCDLWLRGRDTVRAK